MKRPLWTFGTGETVSFAHVPADLDITIVADAPSDMVIVPDISSSREIDAFGDHLDDFPDGLMKGAFGEGASGARPDVWICPLARQDNEDPKENCSTFAYKWADGTISGAITNLRKGDEDVKVTLTPMQSNDDYADDLEDDDEVSFADPRYSFDGVADGTYEVTLVGVPGKWKEASSRRPRGRT